MAVCLGRRPDPMTEEDPMKVRDNMTRDVITVTPATPIHEVASLMANHGVSGLPV